MRAWVLVLCLVIASPVWAFVEQLHPNGGLIPCHAMGAILRHFIQPGGPTGAQLGTIMQREWVPGGWTTQDNTDNGALIALIGPTGTLSAADKEIRVQRVEDYCILWELGVDELDTPAEFRTRIGIAP